jgi:hypothetical protein
MRWVGLFSEGLVIILLLALFWFGNPTAYSWRSAPIDITANSLNESPVEERERICTDGIADCDPHPIIHHLPGYQTPAGWVALAGAIVLIAFRLSARERWSWAMMLGTATALYTALYQFPEPEIIKSQYQIAGTLHPEIGGQAFYFVILLLRLIGSIGCARLLLRQIQCFLPGLFHPPASAR